ncbi:MAG: prephenate dehydrogenase dimerization domain-containing protein, partial [Anaerolineales bacterium]
TSGLPNADPNLFRGAPFAFSPLSRTSPRLRALAQEISRALGARALWLDAETHDRWVAATSHLPYLIAAALALGTLEEAAPLIGPGFRSTSRLASSGVNMMSDILITNRAPILQALSHFRVALDEVEAALRAADSTPLHTLLTQARARRHQLIH